MELIRSVAHRSTDLVEASLLAVGPGGPELGELTGR